MKVLFVYDRMMIPSFGGVERVSLLLAAEMKKRGHYISFMSVGPEGWNTQTVNFGFPQKYISSSHPEFRNKFLDILESDGFDTLVLQGTHNSVLKVLLYVPSHLQTYVVLHNQPFAMHGHENKVLRLTPWGYLSPIRRGLKMANYIFPGIYAYFNSRKNRSVFNTVLSKADKFVMLSNRYVKRMQRLMPCKNSSKLVAINNPNTFEIPSTTSVEKKENIVLFVGRMSNPQKNVTGFIDVWKKFHQSHPDWSAYILGDGEHNDLIRKYAEKKSVKNLRFEGNRQNIADYYTRAKILCMTSSYEGWPMVLAEAMAYGCVPVVYDTFEAVHDIIDTGKSGMIVKPFDDEAMVEALSSLADNPRLTESMAMEGREKIREFSVERIADRWERLFNERKGQ